LCTALSGTSPWPPGACGRSAPTAGHRGGPGAGCGQPSGRALADEVAFELGQGGKEVEDELAAGVVVSIASWRLRSPTPRSARPVTVSTRCRKERPRRSSLQTTRVSPGRSWSRTCSRVGRSVRAPLAVFGEDPVAAGALEGVDLELGTSSVSADHRGTALLDAVLAGRRQPYTVLLLVSALLALRKGLISCAAFRSCRCTTRPSALSRLTQDRHLPAHIHPIVLSKQLQQ
jgi:hypothetical protein